MPCKVIGTLKPGDPAAVLHYDSPGGPMVSASRRVVAEVRPDGTVRTVEGFDTGRDLGGLADHVALSEITDAIRDHLERGDLADRIAGFVLGPCKASTADLRRVAGLIGEIEAAMAAKGD